MELIGQVSNFEKSFLIIPYFYDLENRTAYFVRKNDFQDPLFDNSIGIRDVQEDR